MKVTPLIFRPWDVRAMWEGRKSQTRRIGSLAMQEACNFLEGEWGVALHWLAPVDDDGKTGPEQWIVCSVDYPDEGCIPIGNPYGRPGDLIWVRETWNLDKEEERWPQYRADIPESDWKLYGPWRSPIHMPRHLSRLTLRLTDVRAQRVQDISEDDAKAEGIYFDEREPGLGCGGKPGWCWEPGHYFGTARHAFSKLWNSIHGPDAWDRNDWVFALSYEPIKANVDEVLATTSKDDWLDVPSFLRRGAD